MAAVWKIIRKYNLRTVIITTSEGLIISGRIWNSKNAKVHTEKKQLILNLTTELQKIMKKKCLFTRKF